MVTIGTNGGNTEENLSELVEYIQSQGAIPILNNIPCNESGTQIPINAVIEKVRQKYGINGCKFRSEEHTSELQSLMRISYAVFCLKKKIQKNINKHDSKKL